MRWLAFFLALIAPAIVKGAESGGNPVDRSLTPFEFVMVQYEGETHLCKECAEKALKFGIPNLLRWLKGKQLFAVSEKYHHLKLTDKRIFDFPMLFMEGHYNFTLDPAEEEGLKAFLERGGFLFADAHTQSGGKAGYFYDGVHNLLAKLFPDGKWQVLPVSHEIYKVPFSLPTGLSFCGHKPEEHHKNDAEKKRTNQGGEGFCLGDRMMTFYSDNDCCCFWSGNFKGDNIREKAFMMTANAITYAMTH